MYFKDNWANYLKHNFCTGKHSSKRQWA